MAIAKRPRKKQSRLTRGFRSLSLTHQDQLREARKRLEGRDLFTEGWTQASEAMQEAVDSMERQTRDQ